VNPGVDIQLSGNRTHSADTIHTELTKVKVIFVDRVVFQLACMLETSAAQAPVLDITCIIILDGDASRLLTLIQLEEMNSGVECPAIGDPLVLIVDVGLRVRQYGTALLFSSNELQEFAAFRSRLGAHCNGR
jgi:hypothetical protein